MTAPISSLSKVTHITTTTITRLTPEEIKQHVKEMESDGALHHPHYTKLSAMAREVNINEIKALTEGAVESNTLKVSTILNALLSKINKAPSIDARINCVEIFNVAFGTVPEDKNRFLTACPYAHSERLQLNELQALRLDLFIKWQGALDLPDDVIAKVHARFERRNELLAMDLPEFNIE